MVDGYYEAEGPIIARIKDQVPALRTVAGVHQEIAVDSSAGPFPASIVACAGSSRIDSTGLTTMHAQRWEITVVILAPNDRSGKKARAEAGPIINAIIRALQGWSPAAGYTEMLLDEGGFEEHDKGLSQFSFMMTTEFTI